MRRVEHKRGKTKEDAKSTAALFSGHRMRAGYATSAAAKGLPSYRIQQHTRHKSADMVNAHIREADRWGKSGIERGRVLMTDEPKPLAPVRPVRTPEVESRVDQPFLVLLIQVADGAGR